MLTSHNLILVELSFKDPNLNFLSQIIVWDETVSPRDAPYTRLNNTSNTYYENMSFLFEVASPRDGPVL